MQILGTRTDTAAIGSVKVATRIPAPEAHLPEPLASDDCQ